MTSETRPSTINRPVFYTAAVFILLLVGFAIAVPKTAQALFESIQGWILGNASWFYILVVAIILLSVAFLALSRYGDIKLGPDHSEPDYRNFTWFAMLFSAGMGIGLMFFGVAEPVMHFMAPPVGEGGTATAAREAMKITFFHWGLHAWAIYAVVALTLAFFCYRHGLPLTLRSALYPLIGNRIHGPIGHAVDIFAIIGTVLGVATSLGLGVAQINSGLNHLFGVPVGVTTQIILIIVTCGLATLSVASGLDKGIRILSEANLVLAAVLLLFVLVAGPTVFLFRPSCRTPALTCRTSSARPSTCMPTSRPTGSAAGRCSTGAGGSRGRLSWACSSPASRAAAPSANSSAACCWCRPASRCSG